MVILRSRKVSFVPVFILGLLMWCGYIELRTVALRSDLYHPLFVFFMSNDCRIVWVCWEL